jgi:hypothetical protein
MKNIDNFNINKCFSLSIQEFKDVIKEVTNGLKNVDFEFGIQFKNSNKSKREQKYWKGDMKKALSEYFDIEVLNFHYDECGLEDVWIIFK